MELKFKDFYGQYIHVHNQTASGNIRICVKTMKDLNKVRLTPEADCDTETDISLNTAQLTLLHTILSTMLQGEEE